MIKVAYPKEYRIIMQTLLMEAGSIAERGLYLALADEMLENGTEYDKQALKRYASEIADEFFQLLD